MRITCLIDSLNSGGAQQQMCMLAPLLKKSGMEVEVLIYFPHDFFAHLLNDAGVPWKVIPWKGKLGRIWAVRKALRQSKPDVVIAYLEMPSLLAELAGLPQRNFKLIVSERNTTLSPGFKDKIYYNLHRLADAVVPNSYSQEKVIHRYAPYLCKKTKTIVNCVDDDYYKPVESVENDTHLNILVVGRFEPQKNPLGLLEAIDRVRKANPACSFCVNWYGSNFFIDNKPTSASHLYLQVKDQIVKRSMTEIFILHPPARDLLKVYQSCSVFCLPSLYEGCSNVIAEAMACGKPILAGSVCDNVNLVQDGLNGYLFNPQNPGSIAQAILKFVNLQPNQKKQMGAESRRRAEALLSPEVFVNKYISLIKSLTGK